MRRLHFHTLTLLVAVLGLAGCGDDDVVPTDGGGTDGAVSVDAGDAGPARGDGGRTCTSAADCDDGVSCTRDDCDTSGHCLNPVDLAMCDDGIFCNGVEQCDPRRGCVPGPPETCDDGDVCTVPICDEEMKICRFTMRDFDEDGEVDWHCPGGTDCDDFDPERASTASEICMDLVDNDCDDVIDELECGGPPHDTCDDPLDVSAGGLFTLSTDGAISNYVLTCGGSGWKDLVLRLELTEPKDVTLRVQGSTTVTAVAVRSDCGGPLAPTECNSGYPAEIRRRAMPAGVYFVIVSSSSADEIDVDVILDPPTMPPSNEACGGAIDVSAGGRYTGTFVDVRNDYAVSCGFGGSPDLVYTFTTTEARNVVVSAVASGGEQMNFAIQRTCGDDATSVRCAAGSPAMGTVHSLPAGTYFLVLEGPGYREVDYTLDVAFADPTPPVAGDTCATAIPLSLGTTTLGTLADKEDDHATRCGFYYRDAVYSFTITSPSDVTVLVDGGARFVNASVRTTCTSETTELRCVSGVPARARLRNLMPGTYYVIAEAPTGTGFNVRVDASPPTTPMTVSGNDNCATAATVPVTGGLFVGTTVASIDDYQATCGSEARSPDVAFRLDLAARKRVVASTDGSSFDTVLYAFSGTCTSRTDVVCDDDGGDGSASLVERVLDPGSYFIIVDGFGTGSSGDYTLEVTLSDP